MDQSIINFKVYEDSVEYVGMAQATLPDLTALTQSISGAGIAGNVESVILGHFDAMTLGLNFRTVTDQSVKLSEPRPIVVPVLRAGLGMLEGMTRMLPTAEVGFLGMRRDDDTLEIETYANRLPDDLSGRQCFVLDPMLATGHTMVAATNYLFERGAKDVTCVCILAAPEGVATLEAAIGDRADVNVVVAAVDECLNDKSYIVPGLGDAGDRLYGIID